jgi:hypothetical protein
MRGFRLELLSSTSRATVAVAAELGSGFGQPKQKKERRKRRAAKSSGNRSQSSLVNLAGAGAFAVAVSLGGLTAFPQQSFAQTVCDLTPPSGELATGTGAFACGPGAVAIGANSNAVGTNAQAKYGPDNTAVGESALAGARTDGLFNGDAYGKHNTAVGEYARAGAFAGFTGYARGSYNTAGGSRSFAGAQTGGGQKYQDISGLPTGGTSIAYGNTANGADSFAGAYTFAHGQYGYDSRESYAGAFGNTAVGNGAFAGQIGYQYAYARNNTAVGTGAFAGNDIPGVTNYLGQTGAIGNTSVGAFSVADGQYNTAVGTYAFAYGYGNSVSGTNAGAVGALNTAVGTNSYAAGLAATAAGYNARATGNYSAAIGANTQANAAGSVAIGTDSTGQGAVANLPNEFVMGTQNQTYTAPGITSGLSQARQSGPLEIVTSDANGHLATDNGAVFHQLNELGNGVAKARSGIALAIAMAGPDLTGNERFGMSANWGNFDGANGFGMGFEGVVANDLLITGGRFAITGGFGVGFVDNGNNNTFGNSFGSSSDNVWGGRVGGQWTWGHKAVAYAVPPETGPLK